MTPLEPKSLRIDPLTLARIHAVAGTIRYSDNRFIVTAVEAVLDMIEKDLVIVPELIILARTVRDYRENPVRLLLKRELEKIPR